VCGDHLAVTRLGCGSCGTELAGVFAACEFCALDAHEVEILRVFLASRGNLRELERHLGVSYPTARQRFADLLVKLGLATEAEADTPSAPPTRDEILAQVAAGTLTAGDAAALLSSGTPRP